MFIININVLIQAQDTGVKIYKFKLMTWQKLNTINWISFCFCMSSSVYLVWTCGWLCNINYWFNKTHTPENKRDYQSDRTLGIWKQLPQPSQWFQTFPGHDINFYQKKLGTFSVLNILRAKIINMHQKIKSKKLKKKCWGS